MKVMSEEEWRAEGTRRFGEDRMKWRFKCPSCGHVAAVEDWKAAGASEGEVAFSCVGRHLNGKDAFKGPPGPCNYAGGGLFRINPVRVMHDGRHSDVFEFADP